MPVPWPLVPTLTDSGSLQKVFLNLIGVIWWLVFLILVSYFVFYGAIRPFFLRLNSVVLSYQHFGIYLCRKWAPQQAYILEASSSIKLCYIGWLRDIKVNFIWTFTHAHAHNTIWVNIHWIQCLFINCFSLHYVVILVIPKFFLSQTLVTFWKSNVKYSYHMLSNVLHPLSLWLWTHTICSQIITKL